MTLQQAKKIYNGYAMPYRTNGRCSIGEWFEAREMTNRKIIRDKKEKKWQI